MKPCKYCKKSGRFYPEVRKILCKEHAECQNQFRNPCRETTSMQLEILGSS